MKITIFILITILFLLIAETVNNVRPKYTAGTMGFLFILWIIIQQIIFGPDNT